jgi:hypothetical protein
MNEQVFGQHGTATHNCPVSGNLMFTSHSTWTYVSHMSRRILVQFDKGH